MSKLTEAARGLRPVLQVRTMEGKPIVVGERRIVPVARSVSFTVGRPGGPFAAGFVHSHPVAVLETWRGHTRRIPIHNLTRWLILAIGASGLLLALAARSWRRSQRKTRGVQSCE